MRPLALWKWGIELEFEWLAPKVLDEISEFVLVFNENGDILFGNRAVERTLQYEREELIGTNMSRLFQKEFQPGLEGSTEFRKDRLEVLKETGLYLKSGACIPVGLRILPTGQEGISFLVAEDITGWKDTDVRIRQIKESEEDTKKLKNEFIANVTHELRTPVNGIRGHALSLMDMVEDEEQKKILDIILYCCTNMSAIINDILDFSKLENGKMTLDEHEFDFHQMINQVIATHTAEIQKKELPLNVSVDEKIPQLLIGDELRLGQILNNLISNAVKFTSVGNIHVSVSMTRQIHDEAELFFMVKDTGIGISEKEKDKLFRNFSQVDATITRRFGGTGLGLSITKQLVELMHGNIFVESEKGKGSAFSFFVELHTSQNVSENEKQSEAFQKWSEFENIEFVDSEEPFMQFEERDIGKELKTRMEKLVLSIEMQAWDKAELLAGTIKTLTDQEDAVLKKSILRLEMSIRKSNYEKSMQAYEKLKEVLRENISE